MLELTFVNIYNKWNHFLLLKVEILRRLYFQSFDHFWLKYSYIFCRVIEMNDFVQM